MSVPCCRCLRHAQAHCPAARPSTGRDTVSLMHTDSGYWLSACVSAHTVRIRLPFKARDRTLKIGAVNNNVKTIIFRTKGQFKDSSSEDRRAEWTGVSLMAVTEIESGRRVFGWGRSSCSDENLDLSQTDNRDGPVTLHTQCWILVQTFMICSGMNPSEKSVKMF